MQVRTAPTTVAAVVGLCAVLLGCSSTPETGADPAGTATLTLYNAQHEDLMTAMTAAFTAQSGITVQMRSGEDFELANQLVQEGAATPADVFVTENSPAMTLVDGSQGFAPVQPPTLTQVPARFAPADGNWVGFASRATVLAYHPGKLVAADLPASILDLARPRWKGRIGISPAGADFQAIVSAVLALKGEPATSAWLAGLKDNAKVYQSNGVVMKAVNAGTIDAGVIFHYYWYKDRAESGQNSQQTELHYFGNADPGAFLSVSGAGVLKASKHQAEAQAFVKFLTGSAGQKVLADSSAMEYPIGSGAPANPVLRPLNTLGAPRVELSALNGPQVVALMQRAGLL